jgi:hypothetical protein
VSTDREDFDPRDDGESARQLIKAGQASRKLQEQQIAAANDALHEAIVRGDAIKDRLPLLDRLERLLRERPEGLENLAELLEAQEKEGGPWMGTPRPAPGHTATEILSGARARVRVGRPTSRTQYQLRADRHETWVRPAIARRNRWENWLQHLWSVYFALPPRDRTLRKIWLTLLQRLNWSKPISTLRRELHELGLPLNKRGRPRKASSRKR